MKYTIPFSYTVNANIEIEARSLESAIDQVQQLSYIREDGSCRLIHGFSPVIKSEIDCKSIEIDEEAAEDMNPKNTYSVKLIRTQTVEVEVEAYSESEAEELAISNAEMGGFEEYEHCGEEEIVAEGAELVK